MEENADAVRIYLICANQLIMSMGGPIDISHLSIHAAMRLYKIQDRRGCFEKVLTLSHHFMTKYRDSKQ